jgi:hypothetical protein
MYGTIIAVTARTLIRGRPKRGERRRLHTHSNWKASRSLRHTTQGRHVEYRTLSDCYRVVSISRALSRGALSRPPGSAKMAALSQTVQVSPSAAVVLALNPNKVLNPSPPSQRASAVRRAARPAPFTAAVPRVAKQQHNGRVVLAAAEVRSLDRLCAGGRRSRAVGAKTSGGGGPCRSQGALAGAAGIPRDRCIAAKTRILGSSRQWGSRDARAGRASRRRRRRLPLLLLVASSAWWIRAPGV